MDSLVGRIVSHYRIIERIGAGGMGVVYRAEDAKLGRTVALKFLPPEMTRDRKARERFVTEARAASAIEHSSICTIYEVDEIDDQIFIAMAYYQGKTLRDRIAEGPLGLREALDIASQAAHGLAKAHEHGIVHRDIKPGNIFITEDGEVKIVDFGLAKLAGQVRLTSTGKMLGTVSYMSPEQARGEETGPRTDIWALGVVLYEMVTGELPFKGDYDVAAIYSIMNETPPAMSAVRPGVPDELESIVKKALAKSETERYESAHALLSDLGALKQQLDFSTFTGEHDWQFKRGRKGRIVALAAVAAALAALVVVWRIAGDKESAAPGLPGQARKVTSGDAWQGDPTLSPDGSRIVYSSDESGNKDIYITNASGESNLRLTNDPAPDYYPAWFPDGEAIAFVSERSGKPSIWKMSSLGGGATLLVEGAVDPAISPDGSRIAFTKLMPSGDQFIAVASLAEAGKATVLTGAEDGLWEHRRPAWSPDGKTICYSARQDLWTVPAAGGAAARLTDNRESDTNPAWSSDGKRVYFSSDREGTLALWRVAAKGGVPTRLTQGPGYEYDPSVSADGSRIAYATRREPGALYIRNMSAKTDTKLPGIRGDCLAAIAPDGSKIVFASDRGGAVFDLWMQPLENGLPAGQPQRLTEDSAHASCPIFSPDGKWIAYYRILGEQRDIYTISASGGQPIKFTDDPASDVQPGWSPDGSKIVFASERGGSFDIWIAPVAEGRPAGPPLRLTSASENAIAPVWSPDGTRIAYVGDTERGPEVWIVPADGKAPGKRVTWGANAESIRWYVDGDLFVSARWGEDEVSIRRVSPDGRTVSPIDPPIVLGPPPTTTTFDVTLDGNLVLFPRENRRGNIWVHEAKKGTF